MPNVFRLSSLSSVLLCASALFATSACAQIGQVTAVSRVMSHVDLGVSGAGEFTNTVTGTNYLGATVTQQPSKTLGALITVRYIQKPLIGFEFNYGYARYTQNISNTDPLNPSNPKQYITGGAQINATEYTLGYVVHAPRLFGFQTFASAGLGSQAFRATPHGGQNLPTQARAAYYYDAGIEDAILPHFGIRAQFRQVFFLAPDFGQNYLTIKQRQISTEPAIGFYLHF